MPAIPVQQAPPSPEEMLAQQGVFQRGDHIYITAPVQTFTPTERQIEEYAFSTAVKKTAPNENIKWFKGQYVEADNPNRNGAMWKADELAIKSLTPMLMPVTVMHDPRTAVGTIADVKMLTPDKDGVPFARIDTVLALWGHRFPEAVQEAEVNAMAGTLMQSMECFSPWYECSECAAMYHKLPHGAEEAQWCSHLRASSPSGGFADRSKSPHASVEAQSANASRILGDVCFTGTGLIFGTRGAVGAYSEAHLENFQDELAQYHQGIHTATASHQTPIQRSATMGLVQIEQSELDTLRKERDDARAESQTHKTRADEAEAQVEPLETAKVAAETAKAEAEKERDSLKEAQAQAALKDTRLESLGSAFTEKLDSMPTTKARLHEQAGTLKDEEWTARLTELAESTGVKHDADKDGSEDDTETAGDKGGSPDFSREELARLGGVGSTDGSGGAKPPTQQERASVVGSLGKAFAKSA